MLKSSKDQLETFIAKAEKVDRSPYLKKIRSNKGSLLTFSWKKGEGGGFTDNFPDEDAIDALILTARMFVQGNDQVSFKRLAELENDPGVSEHWKERFRDVRTTLNAHLDSQSTIEIDGERYTQREIFFVFLYGSLAHTEPKWADLYKKWSKSPFIKLVELEFHATICELLGAVAYLARHSKMEIAGEAIPPLKRQDQSP